MPNSKKVIKHMTPMPVKSEFKMAVPPASFDKKTAREITWELKVRGREIRERGTPHPSDAEQRLANLRATDSNLT